MQKAIADAIHTALAPFRLRWEALDGNQQQALWEAASKVSQGPNPQESLHEVVRSIHLEQSLAALASNLLQDEPPLAPQEALQEVEQSSRLQQYMASLNNCLLYEEPPCADHGRKAYYLEAQHGRACAQHATNAMMGAARLRLRDFAAHEASQTGEAREAVEARLLDQGVFPATVHAVLQQQLGMAFHFHEIAPLVDEQGHCTLDRDQARLLDQLDTDRLLLQSNIDGSGASHYVAFRRNGERWDLLDSLRSEPQYDVSPFAYLVREGATSFAVIWPQNPLMVSALPLGTSKTRYDNQTARDHWRKSQKRRQEFGALLKQWNEATGKEASGGALLRQLSALCDKEDEKKRGTPVAGSNNLVWEFTVALTPGMREVRVWRGLYNRVPNLRAAPAPDDDQAREALLQEMCTFANRSAGKRREKLAGSIVYDYQTANNHWHHSEKRRQEFGALLAQWKQATGKTGSGAALLQHLSALCDKEDEKKRGTPVAGSDNLVWEFTATPVPGMGEVRVWRGLDGNGVPNLRAAPAPNDGQARETLLQEMEYSAKLSASKRRDKLVGDIAYDSYTAIAHWRGKRAQEFSALLAQWKQATGKTISGGALLQQLSALCDKEDEKKRGAPVAGSNNLVFEFTVALAPGMGEVRV